MAEATEVTEGGGGGGALHAALGQGPLQQQVREPGDGRVEQCVPRRAPPTPPTREVVKRVEEFAAARGVMPPVGVALPMPSVE